MKNTKIIAGAALIIAVVALALSINGNTLQGFIGISDTQDINNTAVVLQDSALLDGDFDGVIGGDDQCPDTPYQIVLFDPYTYSYYMGRIVKFVDMDANGVMSFSVDGKKYGVTVGQTTSVKPTRDHKGFKIEGIFDRKGSNDGKTFGIVVLKSSGVNLTTGCLAQ